jgi:hypothetical protein
MASAKYSAGVVRSDNWKLMAHSQLESTRQFSQKEDGVHPLRPDEPTLKRAEAIIAAIKRDYLPVPYVTASSDGGISFEWRKPTGRLTINVPAINVYAGYFAVREPGHRLEGELSEENLEFLNEVVDMVLIR